MPKLLSILNRLVLLAAILLLGSAFWLFYSGALSIHHRQQISENFSQFISLQGEDEYILATLVSQETFSEEAFDSLLGFPIGNTDASLSLVANYKYFIRFSELTHQLNGDTLVLNAPGLYLSTPVAFDFSTVQESANKFAFGPDQNQLLQQIKDKASGELTRKGQHQVRNVYDKAAKALADNVNNFHIANGNGGFYKEIMVVFANEKSPSQRRFSYSNSFCPGGPCKLEFNVGKERIFILE